MESRFFVRTLPLSDKSSSGREIESIVAKIYVKDIDYGYDGGPSLQELIDSFCVENGYGYVPASAGSNASVINKEESEPFAVLENGKWVTYHRAKKRQATFVTYIKYSKDSLQKKSGWALVKYEEVDAPE
ncbi:hypothetical protein [Escherichia phage e4/1c]|uniref:Uncharacterized protein n=1 Tax=Escherichia phage e4/1c TaxID=1495286 RepID=A0A023ZVF1_9CAUD|nr:hypothetical protein e41c_0010 [Escherichia phage e4/1c]AHY83160.1 hypothetical protein [Escherichia phage e4/1c]